ncbi:hypothetical protein F7731_04030 [Cytobacillus depressus]|uniref:Uncharacterized protein n=1 Tax=Cytobacillus depressus TaxID=1602942 RepID=A0A6L3VI22_9BACI|nr:hypothetical protein [Cytobacillus depressus]KAB2338725.1 hypothetical protein F7731_04030 [Cytobacillus depressus]
MITIIIAIASLLILTPTLLLLPVGFSVKWKLGLIGVAFLLASAGLLASVQLPLYQTILILFLLSGLVSILLGKRIQMPAPTHIDSGISEEKSFGLEKELLHKEEKDEEPLRDFSAVIDETASAIETVKKDLDMIIELGPILEKKELVIKDYQTTNLEINKPDKHDDLIDIDDDIAFLEKRVTDLGIDESKNKLENKKYSFENTFISDIEKLIEADFDEALNEELPEQNDVVPQVKMEELDEIELSNFVANQEDDKPELGNDEIEIEELILHKNR